MSALDGRRVAVQGGQDAPGTGAPAGKAPLPGNCARSTPTGPGPKHPAAEFFRGNMRAVPEPFPTGGIVPMMATASGALPSAESGWAYELKWDGVRAIAYVDGVAATVRLESRNLNDVTPRYPELHPL